MAHGLHADVPTRAVPEQQQRRHAARGEVDGARDDGLVDRRTAGQALPVDLDIETGILAVLFVVLSIVLAALAVETTQGSEIDTSLDRTIPAATPDPLAPAAPAAVPPAGTAPAAAPADADPLAGSAE